VKIAISPCPNDTYLFYAWIGKVVGADLPIEPLYADIEQLNQWALAATFPLIKLSFPCFAKVLHAYELLPVGLALGFNCGPKIVAKTFFPYKELSSKRIAIPGKETTAHLLLSKLPSQPKNKLFCLYHEVISLVQKGVVDCGLIIHESRFTFQQAQLVEIADLGEIWHAQTKAPLPLGGLAIAREIAEATKQQIITHLRTSLRYADSNWREVLPFVLKHSQEKDPLIVRKHIDTYVNEETFQLSPSGIKAIETLLTRPAKEWLYE
jgi:1,4-dihydroxy-6-naphthoate synthase